LSKRDLKLKIDELSSTLGTFKGLQIEIGRIYEEDWEEPVGSTLFTGVGTFRDWDRKLLEWEEGKIAIPDPALLVRLVRRHE
jgi:CO dehydrogenase/acetyl-CoA synthase alpha subunit